MTLQRLLTLLLVMLSILVPAAAEDAEDDAFAIPLPEMYFEPIPWDVDESPNSPIQSCFLPDNAGYHDDSLDIAIETFDRPTPDGTKKNRVWVVRIRLSDISQLRTASANPKRPNSQSDDYVFRMAKRANAVLAINGDFFCYHTEGVIWRNGQQVRRENPSPRYDVLYIDMNGDFHIVRGDHAKNFQGFDGEILHAFSFGPRLVVDGQVITDDEIRAITANVGKNNLTQRLAFCQTGELEYMVVATEGPEQVGSVGMTIREIADLCAELGAQQAYNLDGGASTSIVLNFEKINATNKQRKVGDCIWFATLVPGR